MKSRAPYFALAVVWLLLCAYGIYFSAYSIQRQRAFLTNASDLGQIDQAVWNSLQGRPLEFTRRTGVESIRLTDHVEPLFVLLSPIFLVYDNVEALLILQSFVIALGALPVFWIARQKLATIFQPPNSIRWQVETAGVLFAAMYLLFPALQAANLAEFHAVTFVPALALFTYYFGLRKKWGRFALFAVLMLMVKEEISLLVFMLAGYFVIFDFRFLIFDWKTLPQRLLNYLKTAPRAPMAFAVLSLLWFGLTMFVIIPQFNALGKSPYTCRYVVDEDCREVARGLFFEQRLGYLFQLFASSGFVSILDPISLLLGSPLILANVISNYPAQYSGTFHYSAPLVPYFVLASIGGSAWLICKLKARGIQRAFPTVIGAVFVIALAYHFFAGYTPLARAYAFPQITARNALFARFAAQIPRDAKVSTTPSLHPHLSHREFLYRFPVVNDADYVLLDVNESDRGIPSEFRIAYNDLVDDGAFGVVDAQDGYVLLKRGAPKQNLPDAFYTPFRASNVAPQYPAQIDFEDTLRFLGYDVSRDQYGRGYVRTYWRRLKRLDQNYVLFPFIADAAGEPLPDLNFPMTCLFWYPSAAWHKNDVVVCETLALEWPDDARLGVGVTQTFDWGNRGARLKISRVEPSTLSVRENTWVDLGSLEK
ncbi:MAG: hypothetical protein BroJett039_02910 [Chloroflexota bacterium]|nr:MAG: hypothetical protein BroJett039_02910 [Chloroflexota bacterium]